MHNGTIHLSTAIYHQIASQTTKLTSRKQPGYQQLTNGVHQTPCYIVKDHDTWSLSRVVQWSLFGFCLIVLGISMLQSAFFQIHKCCILQKTGVILHPVLPVTVISPATTATQFTLWLFPRWPRCGEATVTVLIGLSHLSITRGFLRPQNCYRSYWNITASNNEIFFSRMKRQLAISELPFISVLDRVFVETIHIKMCPFCRFIFTVQIKDSLWNRGKDWFWNKGARWLRNGA